MNECTSMYIICKSYEYIGIVVYVLCRPNTHCKCLFERSWMNLSENENSKIFEFLLSYSLYFV